MCDKHDRAITCVFCRDLYLKLTISGLLKNGVFKGRGKLTERFFKQNYCHACHTRFAVFFPLPSCCANSSLFQVKENRQKRSGRKLNSVTYKSSTVFSAPSPTFIKTSSNVVTDTPKLAIPYSSILSGG